MHSHRLVPSCDFPSPLRQCFLLFQNSLTPNFLRKKKEKKNPYVISTIFFSSHAGSLEVGSFFCTFQPFLFHSLVLLHQLIMIDLCSFSLLLALRLLSLFHFKKNGFFWFVFFVFVFISYLFQLTFFIYPFRAKLPKIMINTWPLFYFFCLSSQV